MYCIYTDREVEKTDGNWDHVVPLSLGGVNPFVVWSDRKVNSELGSQVDGKLGQDPLLSLALRNAGVKGHSGKPAVPVWRHSELGGRPVQITLGLDKISAWDARDRKTVDDEAFEGQTFSVQLNLDLHLANRFLAKVALGAGYFLYGDAFRTGAPCKALRDLALTDLDGARQSTALRTAGIRICDRFHEDSQQGGEGYFYRVLMETTNRSTVIAVPHDDAVSFHVGLVGMFIGTLICPADTEGWPIHGDHDLGHALLLAPGPFERLAFRELLAAFSREVLGEEPPESSTTPE